MNPGLLLTVLNDKPITAGTKTIRLKVQAEEGFHPQTDMDISSLRFGASEEVNYGRGSKVLKTENDGNDLIITFDGKGNGITEKEFAPKLIGRYKNGRCFTDMRVCRMLIMWNRFFLHVPLYSLNRKKAGTGY